MDQIHTFLHYFKLLFNITFPCVLRS